MSLLRAMERQLDLLEAMRQRDLGVERVLDHKSDYRSRVEAAIAWLAGEGDHFTADDVREMVGECPPGVSTNVVGALFNAAAKTGLIYMDGFTTSARVIGHGNLLRQWRGNRNS